MFLTFKCLLMFLTFKCLLGLDFQRAISGSEQTKKSFILNLNLNEILAEFKI